MPNWASPVWLRGRNFFVRMPTNPPFPPQVRNLPTCSMTMIKEPRRILTGYEAAVGETARLTAERRELDAQEAEELNRRLAALIANLPDRPEATIEYFVPDDRKSGGAYVTVTGRVRHISVPEKTLVMEDGTVIGFEDIAAISGFQFEI